MRIKILLNSNPFFETSATANRWLSLINGLSDFEVSIQIIVAGKYNSSAEER